MNILKKLKANLIVVKLLIKKLGFIGAIRAIIEDVFFDYKNGIDTLSSVNVVDLGIDSENLEQCHAYRPSFASCVREVLDKLKDKVDFSSGNLVDMGSGKGKILFVAAEYDFKKIIGVEYSTDLHNICEQNINKMKMEDRVFSINEDGSKYKHDKNTSIYYFFNPFNGDLLDSCLRNIICSEDGFDGYLVYGSPSDSFIFERYADKVDSFRTTKGVLMEIYKPRKDAGLFNTKNMV